MKVLVAIPARFASSRFPGKPLAELRGASGASRTLIRRSWDAAMAAAEGVGADVVIATDDDRIAAHAAGFGAEVAMTPASARNGTERVAAMPGLDAYDCIVNLQGDAPLTPPWYVSALVKAMAAGRGPMCTPVLESTEGHAALLRADRAAGRVGGTTAVTAASGDALYFSKEVLPFDGPGTPPVLHHVGVYAYTPAALQAYAGWPEGPLERAEGLEQLRFLENGHPVACVQVEARGRPFWELNNPEDIPRIEAMMAEIGID